MCTRSVIVVLAALALGLPACGDDGEGDDGGGAAGTGASGTGASGTGGGGTGASGTGGDGTSSGTGGSSSSSGQGGGGPLAVPICTVACSTPSDCDLGSAPYDADNYACEQGGCVYEGCNDNAECQTLGAYTCHDLGFGVSTCVPTCSVPQDCDLGAGPAYDADNYACEQGACVYTGCNSDSECQSLGTYLCRDAGGIDVCQIACVTPSDCDYGAGPAYDADNYSCDDDVCRYTGCLSDPECASLGAYICL